MGRFALYVLLALAARGVAAELVNLDESDWDRMLTGEWMVEFFAPWCPACKALQPAWEEFSTWSKDLGLSVAQVDVTRSPGLSGRFMVTALPTVMHAKDGVFRLYKGSRDKEAFISFVEERKWQQIERIPAWKSPASIQMSLVASFFKLSQVLRSWHNELCDKYGLPSAGSYLIFAAVTIAVGAALGLLMVCCIDLFFPPKAASTAQRKTATPDPPPPPHPKEEDEEEEEAVEDELVDDDDEDDGSSSANLRNRRPQKTH